MPYDVAYTWSLKYDTAGPTWETEADSQGETLQTLKMEEGATENTFSGFWRHLCSPREPPKGHSPADVILTQEDFRPPKL